MKQGILAFTGGLLLAVFAPSPVRAEVDFHLGVKGGLSLSKINVTGESFPSLGKPVFGAFFAFGLSERLAVQPEVYLLTQGMVQEGYTGPEIPVRMEHIFTYVHVPVLAKFRVMNKGKFVPVVFAGPAMDFMTRALYRIYLDGVLNQEHNVKQLYKKTNFGLVFGGGAEFSLEKIFLVLDVRYDLGLSNIDAAFAETVKTRTLLFMVGVGF
jgi:hypothetical protein